MEAIRRVFRPGASLRSCSVWLVVRSRNLPFPALAGRDEWFSDDRKLDDENVPQASRALDYREMSEMIATTNAKSIEEIKSFLSRQKETYKVPMYEASADRLRQCVFGGTTNGDFLPRDRTGNWRFFSRDGVRNGRRFHILDDEAAARAYIEQMWRP